MPDIFPSNNLSPEQQVARQLDGQIYVASSTLLRVYNRARALVYNNSNFPDPQATGAGSNAVYAAFQANTKTGLTAEELGAMARIIKTIVNMYAPDTIIDAVPEVEINFTVPPVAYSGS